MRAFTVNIPSVGKSLHYSCRSSELISTFTGTLKTELFDVAYSKLKLVSAIMHLCFSCDTSSHGAI